MSFNKNEPWVTAQDYSSVPAVISWFMGTTSLLCLGVKYSTKLAMKRAFTKDDAAVFIAMILSTGFIASVSFATANGVGVPQRILSATQIQAVEKSVYAASLMYIATLFCSKGAVLLLLKALEPMDIHLNLIWIATAILIAWAASSFLVIAFQCSVPHTWTFINGDCVNQTAFWLASDVVNIVTELCLCLIPANMFITLQMSVSTKVTIITMFFLRILLIAPISAGLYFRRHLDPSDQSFNLWPVIVCMTVTQALSVVFACAPFLKPFFSALETGMVRLDDTRRLSATTLVGKSSGKANRSSLGQSRHSRGVRHQSLSQSQSHKQTDISIPPIPSVPRFDFDLTPNDTGGWTEIGPGSPQDTTGHMDTTRNKLDNNKNNPLATHSNSSIIATTTFEVRYAGGRSRSQSRSNFKTISDERHDDIEMSTGFPR